MSTEKLPFIKRTSYLILLDGLYLIVLLFWCNRWLVIYSLP